MLDFDGTLIDTWRLYLESFRRSLQPHFQRLLSDPEILAYQPVAERRLSGEVSSRALWWPPGKVAGRYLAPPPTLPDTPAVRADMAAYQASLTILDDAYGAILDASFFDSSFPYLRAPLPGSPNGTQ